MKHKIRVTYVSAFSVFSIAVGCNAVLDNDEPTLDEDAGGTVVGIDAARGFEASALDQTSPIDSGDVAIAFDADVDDVVDASDGDTGEPSCPSGTKRCFGECVSVSDVRYGCAADTCSPCSLARAVAVCAGGACAIGTCNAGYANCNQNAADGCETDLSQPTHCGTCNAACGTTAPLCSSVSGGFTCMNGCPTQAPTRCGNQCVNLTSSVSNCGQCGNACPAVPNGQVRCDKSACKFTCNPGFHACGNACVSNINPATCGNRCTPCPTPPNSTATCSDKGECGFTCNPGFHKCNGACVPNNAVTSCGVACTPCSAPANATATCSAQGTCGFTCNPGFHACGDACVSNTSVGSCGASCTPCPTPANATATCTVQGACGFTCNAGFDNCDANAANGCEAALASDPNHCGNCLTVCPGTACVGGACLPPPSDAGAD